MLMLKWLRDFLHQKIPYCIFHRLVFPCICIAYTTINMFVASISMRDTLVGMTIKSNSFTNSALIDFVQVRSQIRKSNPCKFFRIMFRIPMYHLWAVKSFIKWCFIWKSFRASTEDFRSNPRIRRTFNRISCSSCWKWKAIRASAINHWFYW